MSYFDRRKILWGLAGLSLTACGFTPTYGTGGQAANLKGSLAYAPVRGRASFELQQRLQERLGAPDDGARYLLAFVLSVTSNDNSISDDAEVLRYNLTGMVNYTIKDQRSGKIVLSDSAQTFSGYSTTSETYPSRVAEQDARTRLSTALADLMATKIAATAGNWQV